MEGYRMTFKVVHVRQRGGASAKRVVDLTKTAPKTLARMSPEKPKPPEAKPEPKQECLYITAAPDGPPIAADLPEKLRKIEGGPVQKPLTDKQLEVLDRITQKAGEGHPKTLGLRLVLAASEDELAASWPIGLLSKALHVSGRHTEGDAVHMVAQGCRVSRYRDMAAAALVLLNEKIEAAKTVTSA
jgi:hypothetical protein